MLNVLYLVHDLADPAVRRRVLMLRAGGAEVTLAGFRRGENPLTEIEGLTPIELGATRDRHFAQRLTAVFGASMRLRSALSALSSRPDLILARNLEMLALAHRAAGIFGDWRPPIVYESLDIHRLLLRRDPIGAAFRAAERRLGRNAKLLITSSPAFVRDYFTRFGQIEAPIELLENKVLSLGEATASVERRANEGPPWVIGWFGALRCKRSLALLSAFSRRMEGRFKIVLRGRPAHAELGRFEEMIAAEPFMEFHGPYRNPEDLAAIYRDVHFAWLVDFFEEGANSQWLLPNRLYEGARCGAVPIALSGVESGNFLKSRQLGLLLENGSEQALLDALGPMDAEFYARLADRVRDQDPKSWVHGQRDCVFLVDRLKAISAHEAQSGLAALAA